MNRCLRLGLLFFGAFLIAAAPAMAGTVKGVVTNGTTGKIAPNTTVILLKLENGMQDVAHTKTDAQGRFQLSYPTIGQQPMLLRAVFDGVFYHSPIPPGSADANINISVYNPTDNPTAFQVLHHIIALEPRGANLLVGEEYDIQNKTSPPKTFYRAKGNFSFVLPPGANLGQVEAWDSSGMPVVQGTIDKGSNRYAIDFPFLPGDNGVRFSYEVTYPSSQTTLQLSSLYSAGAAMLLVPPAVTVSANGFSQAGSEHGWTVYSRSKVGAGVPLTISVSGAGPPPGQNGDANGGDTSGGGQGSAPTPVAQALPPRLNSLKWILIAGFGSLFLLGAAFLWWKSRQPGMVPAGAAVAGVPASAPTPPPVPVAPAQPAGEQQLRQSVDEIKETLFRLELRRQAGTISEEEYQAQRQRMEKALRELVKG
jgi:hypothetical protein